MHKCRLQEIKKCPPYIYQSQVNHNKVSEIHTIYQDDEYSMPECWYCFWRKHYQWIQKIVISIPPVNTYHVKRKENKGANKNRDFPFSLQKRTITKSLYLITMGFRVVGTNIIMFCLKKKNEHIIAPLKLSASELYHLT